MGTYDANFMLHGINEHDPLISTFTGEYPNLPTHKTGHYTYMNAFGEHETTFLNCANDISRNQSGEGGFQFHSVNSIQPDLQLAKITRNGLTIDKSVQGGAVLVNLPSILVGQPTQVVFSFPPALDTFGIQYGVYNNPVQVLFNSGPFVVGTTYYAQATNAQTLRIRLTTNPLDPEMDCTSFSFGQIAFAYVSSNLPSTINITNLNTALEITRDETFSALYHDSLVIQDITNNRQALTYAFKSVFQDNNEGVSTSILAPLAINNNQVFNATGKTSSIIAQVDTPNLTITNNTDESVLSATDLTFNTVSLQTTLRDLQIKQITTTNQNISAVITADARPPIAPSVAFAQQYAFNPSWYFKNSFSSGVNKINWYLGPSIGMTVSQLEGVYMNIFNGLTTSNDNTPYIIIFTANDTEPLYYKSKRTYIFNQSVQPIANKRYLMYANISGTCPTPNYYGSVLNNLELSTVAGSQVGAFGPTELIFAFSIHTNSASPLNSVEFAINKFGIMTNNFGTQEVLFIPS